jgi:hypothetical protein
MEVRMTSKKSESLTAPLSTSLNLTKPRPESHTRLWMRSINRLCSGKPAIECVTTSAFFTSNPEAVWDRMLSFEEVRTPPPLILRALLPLPLRTEGDKTCVGASVHCVYGGGDLVKQITTVEPPHLLEFEVLHQRLGIEGCITSIGGCYRITACGTRTKVELVTNFQAFLRPRFFWRPIERSLAHIFHRHILAGMSDSLPLSPSTLPHVALGTLSKVVPPQEPICTTSP